LVDELVRGLEAVEDPETGGFAVARAYKAAECYSGPYREAGPDILVGYNRGYRASWQTALGKIPKPWFETNEKKWSGDHCMAADLLPGILLVNRKLPLVEGASLQDLTATILAAFDVPVPDTMNGKSLL
jgi:predicted AlkP superfamily phosphohydrolase/phosphomutase